MQETVEKEAGSKFHVNLIKKPQDKTRNWGKNP